MSLSQSHFEINVLFWTVAGM